MFPRLTEPTPIVNPTLSDTRNSLLLRLHDQRDIAAWDQFVAIYEPLVFRLARSKGFQECDARDIVQEVLLAVAKAIHRWDPHPSKGRFRDWIFRIARNLMINFLSRRKHQSLPTLESWSAFFETSPEPSRLDPDATQEFDLEYRRQLFWLAADQVREQVKPNTWEAFRLTAIDNLSVAKTARQLGMAEGSVLVAKCRVIARLRVEVAKLETNLDEPPNRGGL
ncbi:MAG: sigma-70 family RNA polymerase sigma factor [Pirellula sp.]|nr:sigma-70 family RNA polymerase sigma factor [Pirellula sp.]